MKTKKERLEALIKHYSDGKPSSFAKHIGVAASTISSWLSRDTLDYDLVFAKCEDISPEWLLTGDGEITKNTQRNPAELSSEISSSLEDKLLNRITEQAEKIGRLENEIEYLKRKEKFGRPDAEAAGVADVG